MEITEKFYTLSRDEWREWLNENSAKKREIWLSVSLRGDQKGVSYLDAVEEALCFGWIDSTGKKDDAGMWQRFSPRRKRSKWTELNRERCRRLEGLGLMTDAGRAVLPESEFVIDDDIMQLLESDEQVWRNFKGLPSLYVRVRIDNIQSQRKRNADIFRKRLEKFMDYTRRGVMYGEWNDGGRLIQW